MEKTIFTREIGNRIEFYRNFAIKKAEYKKGDVVLTFCPVMKKLRTMTISRAYAACLDSSVVEFDLYYFGVDNKGDCISFIPGKNIKRRLK